MKSNIIQSAQYVKMARECMEDYVRDFGAGFLFRPFIKKLEWIMTDMITNPAMPQVLREGIKNEFNGDTLSLTAINDKLPLLSTEDRLEVEDLIDQIIQKRLAETDHIETYG